MSDTLLQAGTLIYMSRHGRPGSLRRCRRLLRIYVRLLTIGLAHDRNATPLRRVTGLGLWFAGTGFLAAGG
jgi:hypothetical protein